MNPASVAASLFTVLSPNVLEAALRVAKFAARVSEEPADLIGKLVDAVNPRGAIEAAAAAFRVELDVLQLAADVEVLKLSLTTLIATQVGDSIPDEPPAETDRGEGTGDVS